MARLIIYSKPGCQLCDHAKTVAQRCGVPCEMVDITGHPELEARYGQDIPVILLDGREIARHVLRERNLLKLLRNP